MREYDPGDELTAGPLRIRFQPVPHFTATNAVEVASSNGGGRITYGADHAPTEQIVEFARDTDLLIIEATLPRPEREGPRGHITPAEAGEHARKAGARRVLLTHFSDELGEDWAREDAEKAFGGAGRDGARGRCLRRLPRRFGQGVLRSRRCCLGEPRTGGQRDR